MLEIVFLSKLLRGFPILFILAIVIFAVFKLKKHNKEDAEKYRCLGYSLKREKKYREAIDCFSKVIEYDSKDDLSYCIRGDIYKCLSEYDKAIKDYTKVIKLNPEDPHAYYNRGFCRLNNILTVKDVDLELYSGVSRLLAPLTCDDFCTAGVLYLKKGNKTEALKCVDNIKQADSSSPLIKKLMNKIYEEE